MTMPASTNRSGPYLVEIAGVAGAGKSSLARALRSAQPACRFAGPFEARKIGHLPFMAHSLPRLAPIAAANLRTGRSLTWTEAKLLIYAMEWPRYLARRKEYRDRVTILDQGPTYALATLGVTEVPIAGCESLGTWWNTTVETWSRELDAIVWLDAPDPVLRERINQREQPHGIKGKPVEVGYRFMATYRRSFDQVFDRMALTGGPEILRYDTSLRSTEEILAEVSEQLAAALVRGGGAEQAGDLG
jgi:gluconate kinase